MTYAILADEHDKPSWVLCQGEQDEITEVFTHYCAAAGTEIRWDRVDAIRLVTIDTDNTVTTIDELINA